jgi:hypothetical protein
MSKINDGGQAFPVQLVEHVSAHNHPGMTLRDYFAAAALQGILASFDVTSRRRAEVEPEIMHRIAPAAYLLADAMLAERERGQQ